MRVFAILVALFSFPVHAQEKSPWDVSLGVGAALWPTTDETLKTTSGNSILSANADGKTMPQIRLELGHSFGSAFKLSLQTYWWKHKYITGNAEPNTQIAFIIMPKYISQFESSRFWVGLGIGFINVSWDAASITDGTTTITQNETSLLAFAYSPAIGYEFDIGESAFIGLQANYISGSGSSSATVISGTDSAQMKEEYTRSNFGALLYVGTHFGAPPAPPMPQPEEPAAMSAQAQAQEASPSQDSSPHKIDADELMKIKKLHDAGILTTEEYQEQKAKLLR